MNDEDLRQAIRIVMKAKDGDSKMIFGKPYHYSGGKWIPGKGTGKKEEPKKEEPKKEEPKKEEPKKEEPTEWREEDYEKHSEGFRQSLSKRETSVLTAYTGDEDGGKSEDWNAALRGKWDASKSDQKAIDDISSLIDKQKGLEKPAILYRGAVIPKEQIDSLVKGAVLSDKAFVSTSTNKDVAMTFTDNYNGDKSVSVLFEIVSPKGTKSIPISSFGEFPEEKEMLLQKGSKFKVHSVEKDFPTGSGEGKEKGSQKGYKIRVELV